MSRQLLLTQPSPISERAAGSPSPSPEVQDYLYNIFEETDVATFIKYRDRYRKATAGDHRDATPASMVLHPAAASFFQDAYMSQRFEVKIDSHIVCGTLGCVVAVVAKPEENVADEDAFFVLVTGILYDNNTTTEEEITTEEEEKTAKEQGKRVSGISGVYLESAKYIKAALKKNMIHAKATMEKLIESESQTAEKASWFLTNERVKSSLELIIGVLSETDMTRLGIKVSSNTRLSPSKRKDGKRQYGINILTGTPRL